MKRGPLPEGFTVLHCLIAGKLHSATFRGQVVLEVVPSRIFSLILPLLGIWEKKDLSSFILPLPAEITITSLRFFGFFSLFLLPFLTKPWRVHQNLKQHFFMFPFNSHLIKYTIFHNFSVLTFLAASALCVASTLLISS